MGIIARIKELPRALLVIVVARAAASIFLLGIWLLWARHQSEYALLVGTGAVIWIVWSAIQTWIFAFRRPANLFPTLLTAALADGVSLGLLTAALGGFEDPFLSWYVGVSAAHTLLLRKRQAWPLTGILIVSYILGHLPSHGFDPAAHYAYVAVTVAGLSVVGFALATVMGDQQQHNVTLEEQRAEVSNLNLRLERSVAELRAVTEITELIHSTLEVESVGPVLLDILEKVINIPTASLYVIDKSKQETVFSTSSAGAGSLPRAYSGLELAGAMPVGSADGALSCIELVDYNQTIVVFCADTAAIEGLTADDRIVLQAVASELVVAVENSRLYRLTKRLAITDELTDLFNYRYLQQRLDDEIGRADRYTKRLSLLMLDLDDFKQVNDNHGHQVGDRVLAEVGQILKGTVREVDVVARYGGEEFTIILPETDASGAFIVAEKIRETISMHRFPDVEGVRSIHLTTSIGLSSYPVHATDKESLLRSADDAVYHAKDTGKDRVRAPRLRLRRLPPEPEPLEEAAE